MPDAVLEIAGAGDYRPELEALAASLDLGERVRFLGRISEAEKLALAASRVGARVRVAEGGVGHHESRSRRLRDAGRRVELAGHSRVGARRRDGLSRAARRRRAPWRAAMRRLAESRELVDALGRAARAFAETFTWERAADETEQHLITRRSPDGAHDRSEARPSAAWSSGCADRSSSSTSSEPNGLDRVIENPDVSSPGLVLAGYVERFPARRLQVLGETEITYLESLDGEMRRKHLSAFFSFPIPCVFVTKGQRPSDDLIELAAAAGVAVILTPAQDQRVLHAASSRGSRTSSRRRRICTARSPTCSASGCCSSGRAASASRSACSTSWSAAIASSPTISSSRAAAGSDVLIGRGHELQRHHMEIRGVGLVDIPSIFGIRAVRQQKRIEVVVQLEEWDQDAAIDRTGLDAEMTTILDVELPKVRVPLNPGKNITVIAEVIAMNHLLKYSGIDPAERFNERLMQADARDRTT